MAEVLDRAADLIEPKGAWTQGVYACDEFGNDLNPDGQWQPSPTAVCRCMYGAVAEIAQPNGYRCVPPSGSWGLPDTDWNDAPERTQAEVVAKLREAAALARTPTPSPVMDGFGETEGKGG